MLNSFFSAYMIIPLSSNVDLFLFLHNSIYLPQLHRFFSSNYRHFSVVLGGWGDFSLNYGRVRTTKTRENVAIRNWTHKGRQINCCRWFFTVCLGTFWGKMDFIRPTIVELLEGRLWDISNIILGLFAVLSIKH